MPTCNASDWAAVPLKVLAYTPSKANVGDPKSVTPVVPGRTFAPTNLIGVLITGPVDVVWNLIVSEASFLISPVVPSLSILTTKSLPSPTVNPKSLNLTTVSKLVSPPVFKIKSVTSWPFN